MNVGEIVTILTALAIAFGAYIWLDEKHADRHQQTAVELDIRQEILDRDIKKDAEAALYYRDLERDRELSPAEKARKSYLEGQLQLKYQDQQMLQEAEQRLKEISP